MEKIGKERLEQAFPDLKCLVFDELDSTNTEARRQTKTGFYGPALIVAEAQTAGRGRQGKSFYSPPQTGIYMTLLYPTEEDLYSAVRMTAKTAVAIYRGIKKETDADIRIKWVNDIYLGPKKISGNLVESVTDPETGMLKALIIGIGINVSTDSFPDDLREKAGSLGEDLDRTGLIISIVKELIGEVSDLRDTAYLDIYRSASCVLGERIVFIEDGIETRAEAVSIDDDGALIVITDDRKTVRLDSGEISVRKEEK